MLLLMPFFILWSLWNVFFRKIIKAGLEYVGDNYQECIYKIPPSNSIKLKINGKCALLISGGSNWATIRVNNGPRQKVFKIRLLNNPGEVEIINDSKLFSINVIIRRST
ncbi:hypothetical protein DFR86_02620 [Acidianus sulfidivorans JP7]|uniref:Uncharacterized protein n=1 Tax=Acidianus sulfidivorans JP7 TaxID=619593 RepID=A0A2U9IQA0_9CREN|nr:hypothetical protein DFR86_02620 [Acidianus sulfidivorans JP7]